MDFAALVSAIRQAHEQCAATVNRAVNTTLTVRNWIIGGYVHHYELHGKDRAQYGENLFSTLAERLTALSIPNCNKSRLYRYRDFFTTYPQIVATVSPQFRKALVSPAKPAANSRVATLPPLSGQDVVEKLSYSHIELLLELEDSFKRAFYEIECIRGNWSVRQLKRQIATLYFERSGLSRDKEKLAALVKAGAETAEPKLAIRDPYIFEFQHPQAAFRAVRTQGSAGDR
ncbi:MAG: hypothetical protein HY360_06575 [Verrucomicrobia bacterium]|nr:hypothetical protein [Verrucomicrobiota bacterium]